MFGLLVFHLERFLRPGRKRRIARTVAELRAVDPGLHRDIGLTPAIFRDVAEAVVDVRMAEEAARDAVRLARLRAGRAARPVRAGAADGVAC